MLGVLTAFSQANHVAFAAQTQGVCPLLIILKTGKGVWGSVLGHLPTWKSEQHSTQNNMAMMG